MEAAPLACANKGSTTFLNGGYWPLWKHGEGVSLSGDELAAITHIHYAFAHVDEDGTVHLPQVTKDHEVVGDGSTASSHAWTQHKKESSALKITLAIGGGSGSVAKTFAEVCVSPMKRFAFVQSVGVLLQRFGFDGVDIDWEYPNGQVQAKLYLQLLTELRQSLGWHRWITTALPAGEWALKNLDLQKIAKIVDFINLMAYDFVGPTFANVFRTGHHAQLYESAPCEQGHTQISAAHAVEYLLRCGVPPRKIMLGVPTYGRCFKGALAPSEPFDGPGSGNDATYEVKHLPRPGMVEKLDESVVAAYASGNGEFITYDNKNTVRIKAGFVVQENLRGLFYWHLAGDRAGSESLIRGGYEVLRRCKTVAGGEISK